MTQKLLEPWMAEQEGSHVLFLFGFSAVYRWGKTSSLEPFHHRGLFPL